MIVKIKINDGKIRETDVADTQGTFHIIQSLYYKDLKYKRQFMPHPFFTNSFSTITINAIIIETIAIIVVITNIVLCTLKLNNPFGKLFVY